MNKLRSLTLLFLSTSLAFTAPSKMTGFPAIASSAETGVQVGGLLMYFFPTESQEQRPSTLGFALLASFKNQWQVNFFPEFFLSPIDKINLNTSFTYWPTSFYGLGNQTKKENESKYTSRNFTVDLNYDHLFFDILWLGPQVSFSDESIDWKEEGIQNQQNLIGLDGVTNVGLGIQSSLDLTNHHNSPTKGIKLSGKKLFYTKALGADSNFQYGEAELSGFYTPIGQHIFAAQVYSNWVMGDVPFRNLVSPNGTHILRGVIEGQYRDRRQLAYNLEYRSPFIHDMGLVGFVDWSQVANEWSDIKADGYNYSPGIGFRYALNPEEKFHIRADFALLHGTDFQMVISIKESF